MSKLEIPTFDFNIDKFWVDTQCQVARQSPRRGGPCNQRNVFTLQQGKVDDHRGILDILKTNTNSFLSNYHINL